MHASPLVWLSFFAVVLALLGLDMGVLRRKEREIGLTESLLISAGYVAVALGFGAWLFFAVNPEAGRNFITGYLIEKSLSLDNIFIISLVFHYFHIPRNHQHRVLSWGILGVVVLRGLLIALGAVVVREFHFVLYFFGAFMAYTGLRMLLAEEKPHSLENNRLLRWLRRHMRITARLHGRKFFAQEEDISKAGRLSRRATPLFMTLLFIELADIVFALDSVPAVFGITTDPFVVYTSNIFAVLGLRALYFALEAMLTRFSGLKQALAFVLIFIGGKIFLTWFGVEISSTLSLCVTITLLAGGVLGSFRKPSAP